MKKIMALLLAAIMVLSFGALTACGEKKAETTTPAENTENSDTETGDTNTSGEKLGIVFPLPLLPYPYEEKNMPTPFS